MNFNPKKKDVIGVGDICIDLLVRLNKLPKQEGDIESNFQMHPGGNTANFIVGCSKLGLSASFVGKVGNDVFGKYLIEFLRKNNIDYKINYGKSTGLTISLMFSKGKRSFIFDSGSNNEFGTEDMNIDYLFSHRCLYCGGFFHLKKLRTQNLANIFNVAQKNGSMTLFDPGWDHANLWLKDINDILKHTSVLFVNKKEAEKIAGKRDLKLIAKVLSKICPGIIVIKLGERGCFIHSEKDFLQPGFKVESIDGTGAGDMFDAGFVFGLLRKWDLEKTAKFANAVGALTTTKIGAYAPTNDEIFELMRNGDNIQN